MATPGPRLAGTCPVLRGTLSNETSFPGSPDLYGVELPIDIFIRPESKNAAQLLDALSDFGYDLSDITLQDLLTQKVLIRQYLVETDIHPFVAGVTFDQIWKNRVSGTYGNENVFYASLDDLITMKKAAGRPKDLEDLNVLRILKQKK